MPLIEVVANPIQRFDPVLAQALEKTVFEALDVAVAGPVVVRFALWTGEDDGPRYVCKVESIPTASVEAPPAWRWWSPLVRTPAELAEYLRDAIRSRGQQPLVPRNEDVRARDFWGWGIVGQAGA